MSPNVKISFTPHVIPAVRGIMTTAHVFVNRELTDDEVRSIYEEYYRGKPFIRMNKPSLVECPRL